MEGQGAISDQLNGEAMEHIYRAIADVRRIMDFLETEPADDDARFRSILTKRLAHFIDRALQISNDFPQLFESGEPDPKEFRSDYALVRQLTEIHEVVSKLADDIDSTIVSVSNSLVGEAFDVYSAAQANKKTVPGLMGFANAMTISLMHSRRDGPSKN